MDLTYLAQGKSSTVRCVTPCLSTFLVLNLLHFTSRGYRVKSACKLPQPNHEHWTLSRESYTTACQILSFSSRIKVDHVA